MYDILCLRHYPSIKVNGGYFVSYVGAFTEGAVTSDNVNNILKYKKNKIWDSIIANLNAKPSYYSQVR